MSALTRLAKELDSCNEILGVIDATPGIASIRSLYDTLQTIPKQSIQYKIKSIVQFQSGYKGWTDETKKNVESIIKKQGTGLFGIRRLASLLSIKNNSESPMLEYLNLSKLTKEIRQLAIKDGRLIDIKLDDTSASFKYLYQMIDFMISLIPVFGNVSNWGRFSSSIYAIYYAILELPKLPNKEMELMFTEQWKSYLESLGKLNDICMVLVAKLWIEDGLRYIDEFFMNAVKPVTMQLVEVIRKMSKRPNDSALKLEHENIMANEILPEVYELMLEWKNHFSEKVTETPEAKKNIIAENMYKKLEGIDKNDDDSNDEIFTTKISWTSGQYKIGNMLSAIKETVVDRMVATYNNASPKHRLFMESIEKSKQWISAKYNNMKNVLFDINEMISVGGILETMILESIRLHFSDTIETIGNLWIQSRTSNRGDLFGGSKTEDNNTVSKKILSVFGFDKEFINYMTVKSAEYEKFVAEQDAHVKESVKSLQESKGFGKIANAARLIKRAASSIPERKPNEQNSINSHFTYGETITKYYDTWFGANGIYMQEFNDTLETVQSGIEEMRKKGQTKRELGILDLLKLRKVDFASFMNGGKISAEQKKLINILIPEDELRIQEYALSASRLKSFDNMAMIHDMCILFSNSLKNMGEMYNSLKKVETNAQIRKRDDENEGNERPTKRQRLITGRETIRSHDSPSISPHLPTDEEFDSSDPLDYVKIETKMHDTMGLIICSMIALETAIKEDRFIFEDRVEEEEKSFLVNLNELSDTITDLQSRLSTKAQRSTRSKGQDNYPESRSIIWSGIKDSVDAYIILIEDYLNKSGILDEEAPEPMMIEVKIRTNTNVDAVQTKQLPLRRRVFDTISKLFTGLKGALTSPRMNIMWSKLKTLGRGIKMLWHGVALLGFSILRLAMMIPLMMLRSLIHGFVESMLWAIIASTGVLAAFSTSRTLYITSRAIPLIAENGGYYMDRTKTQAGASFTNFPQRMQELNEGITGFAQKWLGINIMDSEWILTIKNMLSSIKYYVDWVKDIVGDSAHFIASQSIYLRRFIDADYEPGALLGQISSPVSVGDALNSILGTNAKYKHGGVPIPDASTGIGQMAWNAFWFLPNTVVDFAKWGVGGISYHVGSGFGAIYHNAISGFFGTVADAAVKNGLNFSAWSLLAHVEYTQLFIGYLLNSLVWYLTSCITEFIMHVVERFFQYKRFVAQQRYHFFMVYYGEADYEKIEQDVLKERPPTIWIADINWALMNVVLDFIKKFPGISLVMTASDVIFNKTMSLIGAHGTIAKTIGKPVVAAAGIAFNVLAGPTWGVFGWYKWAKTKYADEPPLMPQVNPDGTVVATGTGHITTPDNNNNNNNIMQEGDISDFA